MVGWSGIINCHYGCVAVGVGDLNDQNHVGVGEFITCINVSIFVDFVVKNQKMIKTNGIRQIRHLKKN